jgi:uncharacterized protein YebE (UPF0316 family)
MPAILVYIVIFVAKLTEVSLSTVRNVLINRGEKMLAAIIGFFEVLIWIIVVSNVLSTLSQDPIKVVVYCLAFACGNYLGIMIEGKLALGTACIQVMVTEEMEAKEGQAGLKKLLHDKGFGVTTVPAHGVDREVDLMMIYLTRKRVGEALELIRANTPSALVTVGDVRQMRGGYVKK